MYGLISVPAAQGEIRTLPLEQHSMTRLAPASSLKYQCPTRAGNKHLGLFSCLASAPATTTTVTTVWSWTLLLSSASIWCLKTLHCCTPVWPKHLKIWGKKKREEKKCGPDVKGENPSQQQLDYWQQHMKHVSSWARAAIISDGQTNTWHWFDLSICTAEYRVTAMARLCRRACRATKILC